MSYDSDPRPRNDSVNFLYGKVDEALQNALSLQDQPELFHEIILQLRKNADETLSFTAPIWPQKKALKLFVQKSMASFPSFFGSCHQDISLLHHLQRYAACYLAYKSGYFENMNYKHQTARPKSRTKQCVSSNEKASQPKGHDALSGAESGQGPAAIKAFLAGCQPPMSHLFESFKRVRITGEVHLHALACRSEASLRQYLVSSDVRIATTPLELEALVQALAQRKI